MFSLKTCTGFVSRVAKLAPTRQIFLSCRKQVDDEWRPSTNTTNQAEDENAPMGVSVEKS